MTLLTFPNTYTYPSANLSTSIAAQVFYNTTSTQKIYSTSIIFMQVHYN